MKTRSRDSVKQEPVVASLGTGAATLSGPVALAGAGPRPARVKMPGLIPDFLGGMRFHYPPAFLLRDMGLDTEDPVLRRWAGRYLHWRRIRRDCLEEARRASKSRWWQSAQVAPALERAAHAHRSALNALAYLRGVQGLPGMLSNLTDG